MVQQLIGALADSLAHEVRPEFENLPLEKRMARLIDLLGQEGFLARWQHTEEGLQLIEYHCPYYLVGQRHREICQIDETLIRVAMDAEVEKGACLLDGDAVCTFVLLDGQDEDALDPAKPGAG
jgi:predicted ArsR family transcriptional regulator